MDTLKRKLDAESCAISTASSNESTSEDSIGSSLSFASPERPKRLKNSRGQIDDDFCAEANLHEDDSTQANIHDDSTQANSRGDDSTQANLHDDSAIFGANFSHSAGFNPASIAEDKWKRANYRLDDSFRCSYSNEENDDDEDGVKRDDDGRRDVDRRRDELFLADSGVSGLEDGGVFGDEDDDVNLVLDLLMKKVCLESDDVVLENLF